MKTFVTSDTHFGHENIIRYCGRPFKSSVHMDEHIVAEWNSRVDREDFVYHLGDFAMGPKANAEYVIDIMRRLNGHIYFVLGNHDQPHKKYNPRGLRGVMEDANLFLNSLTLPIRAILPEVHFMEFEGTDFVMCHRTVLPERTEICLHGHEHTQFGVKVAKRQKAERRYDVGVDMFGGPVQLTGDLRYLNDPQGWK